MTHKKHQLFLKKKFSWVYKKALQSLLKDKEDCSGGDVTITQFKCEGLQPYYERHFSVSNHSRKYIKSRH
jgi:hypothetical protein